MSATVNIKKYIATPAGWRFVPVLRVNGRPRPEAVVIDGQPVRGTSGTFYIEWRENGKRIQKPAGRSAREALDAWRTQTGILNGEVEEPDEQRASAPPEEISIQSAADDFLEDVKATKSPATWEAYRSDLRWFGKHIERTVVASVTRKDIVRVLGVGREEGRSQATINRAVMVGLMALRRAGAQIKLGRGDWPKIGETDVEIYEPDEIGAFFAACDQAERLLFQVYLFSGFRNREVATLRRRDVDVKACTLAVQDKPELGFKPKSYECRRVRIPAALAADLRAHMKKLSGALLFPTRPHPTRPRYGGDSVDTHHLELCKQIAHRAGLNCGLCVTAHGKCSKGPCCARWRLHKWRDTYATAMVRSRIDIRTLQALLGHKQLSTTQKYLKALGLDEIAAKVESSTLAAFLSPK